MALEIDGAALGLQIAEPAWRLQRGDLYPLAKARLARPDSPLARIAESQHATPGQIALARLLHRSPAMLPIPGTSSIAHFEENLGSASIRLPGGGSTGYALLNLVYASGSASRSANAYLRNPRNSTYRVGLNSRSD